MIPRQRWITMEHGPVKTGGELFGNLDMAQDIAQRGGGVSNNSYPPLDINSY